MSTPGINPYYTPYVKPVIPTQQVVEMTPDDLKEVTGLIQNHMELLKQKKSLENQRTEIRQNIAATNERIQTNTIAAQEHMALAIEHRARAEGHRKQHEKISEMRAANKLKHETEKQAALVRLDKAMRNCINSVLGKVFMVEQQLIKDSIPKDKRYSIQVDLDKECLKIDVKEMREIIVPFIISNKKQIGVNFGHFKDEVTEPAMLYFFEKLPETTVKALCMKRPLTPNEIAFKDQVLSTLGSRKLTIKQM